MSFEPLLFISIIAIIIVIVLILVNAINIPGTQGPPGPQGPQGPQGQDGQDGINGQVTYDYLQANSLWCTDNKICKIPDDKVGIDYGGAQMYNVINSKGLLTDFNINSLNDLYINGNTVHITQDKLYVNSRDILNELDKIKNQINILINK